MREALLVDDDHGFVETLAMLLRFEGYAVILSSRFDSAVQYLRASTPEVLITDIAIGESNGWELVRYANQHKARPARCCSHGRRRSVRRQMGVFLPPVFLKPFDPVELFDYLRQHAR